MSGTEAPTNDGPGIRDILERMDGGETTNLLSDEPAPREAPEPQQEDAEAVAEQLRRSAETETKRARAAEQQAAQERQLRQQAQRELYQTRQSRDETEYNAITSSLADRESEVEHLKREIKTAAESGDHIRIAEINLRLGEIGGDIRDLRQGKIAFENQRNHSLRQPEPTPEPSAGEWTTVGMPREEFMRNRDNATKEWLRNHDEFFTDPRVMNKVMGAHQMAIGEDHKPGSAEYFRFIEEKAGMSGSAPPKSSRGSSAPPAAPPSREAPGPTGRNSSDVYVSPEERRAAEWMMSAYSRIPGAAYNAEDAKNYAIEKAELKRRGDLYGGRRR